MSLIQAIESFMQVFGPIEGHVLVLWRKGEDATDGMHPFDWSGK